jgi:SAM-dependent methyltransferase
VTDDERTPSRLSRDFTDRLTWEEKAKVNPLWAVMAVEEFEGTGPDAATWSEDQVALFFEKGRTLFNVFLQPPLERLRADPGKTFVVEYGSGMGRILRAFHEAGYRCAGVDISETMLKHSRTLVPEVEDLHLVGADGRVPLEDGVADYVYSYAVLQHIPRTSLIRRAVGEMCRILRPGGLLRLQFQPATMPFGARPRSGSNAVNFDRHSLVFRWARLQNRLPVPSWVPRLPLAWVQQHNNWIGVPLRWQTMQSWLQSGGVRLLSLERDPAADWNSVWLLGKKDFGG